MARGEGAHLAEALHAGPQVQQHVPHGQQDAVHGQVWDGLSQPRLHRLVQQRGLVLAPEGRLQQGPEGGVPGVLGGRAAWRLRKLEEEDRQSPQRQVHSLGGRSRRHPNQGTSHSNRTPTGKHVTTQHIRCLTPEDTGCRRGRGTDSLHPAAPVMASGTGSHPAGRALAPRAGSLPQPPLPTPRSLG